MPENEDKRMSELNRPNNRLAGEISPYLLQHAHNPVDWYPWGDEAFARARAEDKAVFLSIGYSPCHWCHVMEKESFEDEEVAAALNKSFVCIKVDREERPDIDAVYMAVCQRLTGGGGWPLSVFMTPEQKPFFAGTYIPKRPRYGQRGLLELLELISRAWQSDREGILAAGEKIAASFTEKEEAGNQPLSRETVETGATQLERMHDLRWGGFSLAPKFPTPHHLLFLMRCHLLGVGSEPLAMVERTLQAMYRGGIFDHIGGGFSRYSTDEKWLAPHFEKMLYDNALLTLAYTEAFQLTGDPLYRGVAEKTLAYVAREMTGPEGGFYSAQDADSEGEEGKYYTFSPEEIIRVLGEAEGRAFCARYDVSEAGNFEGRSIPNLIGRAADLPDAATEAQLSGLYDYRLKRYPLHKDDKALTSWNAMMISAHARAYRVFGRPGYLESAERAHAFIARYLTAPDGSLKVSFRSGQAQGQGLLDDYAFLAWACLELYESTFRLAYLEQALALMERVLDDFSGEGGFYLSPRLPRDDGNARRLLFRPREFYDGATPSGNSAAAWCLARLAALTGEERWQTAAERQLSAFGTWFGEHPAAVTFALTALMQVVYPAQELVCVLAEEAEKTALALRLGSFAHPQAAVLAKAGADQAGIASLAPFAAPYPCPSSGVEYYLCQNRRCEMPSNDFAAIRGKLLGEE